MELGRKKKKKLGRAKRRYERKSETKSGKERKSVRAVMGETEMCLLVTNVTITPTVCFFLEQLIRGAKGRELG